MEVPWNCSGCGHENMIDLENLSEWPADKLTPAKEGHLPSFAGVITALGFMCENCGAREAVSYTSVSLREAEKKLSRYGPNQAQFQYLFARLVRKVSGMVERMTVI